MIFALEIFGWTLLGAMALVLAAFIYFVVASLWEYGKGPM